MIAFSIFSSNTNIHILLIRISRYNLNGRGSIYYITSYLLLRVLNSPFYDMYLIKEKTGVGVCFGILSLTKQHWRYCVGLLVLYSSS